MSDLVLDVGLAHEIKMAARRANATGADLKTLSTGDMFRRILPVLRGLGEVTVTKHLCHVGTVLLPMRRKKFNPDAFFTTGNGLYVWGSFREHILLAVLPMKSTPKMTFTAYDLTESLTDEEIRAELGDGHVFESASRFCVYLAELLTRQKNGEKEKGDLLMNGYANIAYVRGVADDVFAVIVRWSSADRWWGVCAYRLDDYRWIAGYRVLSSNC